MCFFWFIYLFAFLVFSSQFDRVESQAKLLHYNCFITMKLFHSIKILHGIRDRESQAYTMESNVAAHEKSKSLSNGVSGTMPDDQYQTPPKRI